MNVYDITVKDRNGNDVSLDKYKGNVLLIFNSATECGFTPQYDELSDIYDKYNEKGLVVLDFPCNQFANQAPGSDDEIASFCTMKFGVKFPIFAKTEVKGANANPLFKFLTEEKKFAGFDANHPLTNVLDDMLSKENPNYKEDPSIKWNFTKFVVDRDGNVVARFEPTTDLKVVAECIESLL